MILIEITQGQMDMLVGLTFIMIAAIFYYKLYDRDFKWNSSENKLTTELIVIFLLLGAFLMFLNLNIDYKWIDIQVVNAIPLIKVINGIPMTYDIKTHLYTTEVITPYHTDQTLIFESK